jgi:arylsulfatase A-like enzyme
MEALKSIISGDDWVERQAVSQAASTLFAFPQILGSQHHLDTLEFGGRISTDNTVLNEDSVLLPEYLSEQGYATGAFAASNPNLELWADHFDVWHNRDLERFPNASSVLYEIDYYWHLLLQQPRVGAKQVATQAKEWFTEESAPRFCWMHLMEPHSPYYPGIQKASNVGLRNAYRASHKLARSPKREILEHYDADQIISTLEKLYYKSVACLDNRLSTVLSFIPDDAIVVLMGDHGEEFHHGWLEHTRLYDECVYVPFYSRHLAVPDTVPRQLDLAPSLLDELNLPIPNQWDGEPFDGYSRPSYMVEPGTSELEYIYTGVRTEDRKVIESRPKTDPYNIEQVEVYDLMNDPAETQPLDGTDDITEKAQDNLHQFLTEANHSLTQFTDTGNRDVDASVERRLSELGYT